MMNKVRNGWLVNCYSRRGIKYLVAVSEEGKSSKTALSSVSYWLFRQSFLEVLTAR